MQGLARVAQARVNLEQRAPPYGERPRQSGKTPEKGSGVQEAASL